MYVHVRMWAYIYVYVHMHVSIYDCYMYIHAYISTMLGDHRPEPVDLHRYHTKYCKHWRSTGLHLGLELSVLNQVEADYNTLNERFRVTLEKWLQLNVGVTWGNLELAITNANRESLSLQPLATGKRYITSLT